MPVPLDSVQGVMRAINAYRGPTLCDSYVIVVQHYIEVEFAHAMIETRTSAAKAKE